MVKRPSDPYRYQLRLRDSITGALTDADSLPVATLVRNGTDDATATAAFPVTVTHSAAGTYKVSGTVPSTYADLDDMQVRLDFAVAGVPFSDYTSISVVSGTVVMGPAGLDQVQVEPGVNARQALSPILAASAGALTNSSGTVVIKGGNTNTARITATTDNAGNRTAVNLNLPA